MKLNDVIYFYPETGMLDCNTYVIRGEQTILIDVGAHHALPSLTEALLADGLKPEDVNLILNTHLHIDHCGANQDFKRMSGAKLLLHPLQSKYYDYSVVATSRVFGLGPITFEEDGALDGLKNIEIITAPGHSPDSVCFYSKEGKFLVCGDVLFNQNTGRVDLPGGNGDQLKKSIENLSTLEIAYLLPGHMDIVSGADKIKYNFKFVKENVFPWL